MREVCAKHDISHSKLTRFEEGESAIVFSIDNDQLPVPEWAEFVRQRCAACQGHQARGGVHEFLVEQVPSFMEAYLPDPNAVTCSAILHTELTREAWYIERANGSWILSGLFDFGDVLIGDPGADCLWREFDLSLLRSNLAAYGYEDGVFADANLIEKVTFDFSETGPTGADIGKPGSCGLRRTTSSQKSGQPAVCRARGRATAERGELQFQLGSRLRIHPRKPLLPRLRARSEKPSRNVREAGLPLRF